MYCPDGWIESSLLKRVAQERSVSGDSSLTLAAHKERTLCKPMPKLVRTHRLLPDRCSILRCRGTLRAICTLYRTLRRSYGEVQNRISGHEAKRSPSRQAKVASISALG